MILQCGVLFAFLSLGELVVMLTGVPVPSSIIGMLLLTLGLKLGIVRLSQVEKMADFLVQWLPIVGASVASTVVILLVTGHVHQHARHMRRSTKA